MLAQQENMKSVIRHERRPRLGSVIYVIKYHDVEYHYQTNTVSQLKQ
jgi:hypothetical protein